MRTGRFDTRFLRERRYEMHYSDVRLWCKWYISVHNQRVSNLKNLGIKTLYTFLNPIPSNVRRGEYKDDVFYRSFLYPKFTRFDTSRF